MDQEKYQIRPLAADDISVVASAMAQGEGYEKTDALVSPLKYNEETVAGYIDHPRRFGHIVVTKDKQEIVGFLLAEIRNRIKDTFEDHSIIDELPVRLFPSTGKFCEVFELWVEASHRRKGLATELKLNLEAYLKANKCWSIYTHTESDNTHVLRLNEKLRYTKVRTGPIWDHVERVSLMKDLSVSI